MPAFSWKNANHFTSPLRRFAAGVMVAFFLAVPGVQANHLPAPIALINLIPFDDLLIPVPVPFHPDGAPLTGDFNGDGWTDLLVQAPTGSGTTHLFYATAPCATASAACKYNAAFQQRWDATHLGLAWGSDASTLYVGDYNSDGRADLILESRVAGGRNALLYSNASGNNSAAFDTVYQTWDNPPPNEAAAPSTVNTTANATVATDQITVITLIPFDDLLIPVPAIFNPGGVRFKADLNGDGKLDIFIQALKPGDSNYIFLADANNKYTAISQSWSGAHLGIADWSAQSVSIRADNGQLVVWTNDPTGTITRITSAAGAPGKVTLSVTNVWDNSQPAVGATAGAFAVSPTGAATYTIPLTVPPGVAGMTPGLALHYSSQSGNGLLGMGWSLGGLSTIHRCPRTVAQDGAAGGINFDINDRLCLDGQRLVAVGGAYWGVGTEYRTEIESFQRVISVGGAAGSPGYFQVYTKAGQQLFYGATVDSRVETQAGAPRLWALNKTQDLKGNAITVSYQEVTASGEFYPNRIDYAGNRSVQFTYEPRSDASSGYEAAGSFISNAVRLANIKAYVTYSGKDQLVRDYRLRYAYTPSYGLSHRARLETVQECSTTECFAPTQFAWQEGTPGFGAVISAGTGHTSPTAGLPLDQLGDFDGDGRTDIVKFSGGYAYVWLAKNSFASAVAWGSGFTATEFSQQVVLDVNGDGKADVVNISSPIQTPGAASVWLSNGNGFIFQGAQGSGFFAAAEGIKVGDFNGDGRADLVSGYPKCSPASLTCPAGSLSIWFSTGTGYGAPSLVTANVPNSTISIGDIDGDGRSDIIRVLPKAATSNVSVYKATDAGFTALGTWTLHHGTCTDCERFYSTDVNGDGKTDIVEVVDGLVENGLVTNRKLHVWLWNGSTFVEQVPWSDVLVYGPNPKFADLNGDGRADLFDVGIFGDATVRYSYGTGFWLGGQWWENGHHKTDQLGDFNGDGRIDTLRFLDDGATTVKLATSTYPDLLRSITNGFGVQTTVAYKPLTDSSVYTLGSGAAYPEIDVLAPMYVVASYDASNGIGGKNITRYFYRDAKAHLQGRGFLGFARVEMTDPQGIVTATSYRQDYPYTGQIAMQQTTAPGVAQPLLSVTNYWVPRTSDAGRIFPVLDASTETKAELNGVTVTTRTTSTTYNTYGSPTAVTVTTAGGGQSYTQSAANTYLHSAAAPPSLANWLQVGQITSATVLNTVPVQWADTNPQGATTRTSSFTYHPDGLLKTETIEPNNTALWQTTTYGYDARGNRVSATVSGAGLAQARTSTTDYGPDGLFPVRSANALGHSETRIFEGRFGSVTSQTGPNGLTTTSYYDDFGRLAREVRADGTQSSVTYSRCHYGCEAHEAYYVITQATAAPTVTVYYDRLGRELRRIRAGFDGRLVSQETQYDTLGRVSQTSRPHFVGAAVYWTALQYDVLGRLIKETTPDGKVSAHVPTGLTSSITTSHASITTQTTTRVTNAIGQLIRMTDAAGGNTYYDYDPFGNLRYVKDNAGNATINTYDVRGRKTKMVDPDMGCWVYQYNAVSEIVAQWDARSNKCANAAAGATVATEYDVLGRLTKRTEAEGISQWAYDSAAVGKGKLTQVTGPGGYKRVHTYDSLGRPVRTATTINAVTYAQDTGYDAYGRVEAVSYPETAANQRFKIYNTYTATGYLATVKDTATGKVYWQANARDAAGHLLQETLGNGLVTTRSYNLASGAVQSIRTGATSNVQNLTYAFDVLGNLQSRNDVIQNTTETFGYDVLNRLTSVSGPAPKTYAYDSLGNLTSKSDVGAYSYGAKPHAVTATTGAITATYTYDANGNLTSGNGRTLAYTSYNMPRLIERGTTGTTFTYDPDRTRTTQTAPGETTVYLNPRWDLGGHYEKTTHSSGIVEHKHYLYGSHGPVALYTLKSDGTSTTRYLHKDPLGSVDTLTNDTGAVLERYSYDAFGKRRLPNGTDGAVVVTSTHHGYTGHEHLDGLGLIHMNGRIYDPTLGRFTQADPYIQDPTHSQSLNRYSYVVNNPFKYTDPSGYKFFLSNLTFNNIKKFAAQETTNVVRQLSNIPYVGGLATIGLFAVSPGFSIAYGWSNNNWSTVAKAHAAGAVIALTYWVGGAAASGYTGSITAASATVGGATAGTYVSAGATYIIQSAAIGYTSGFAMASIYGASYAEARQAGNMGAINGIKTAFMHMGFEAMKAATNASSAASGNTLTDPESGDLFVYGGRPTINSIGGRADDQSLFAFLNMTQEAEGQLNSWWSNSSIRRSFNNIAKVHDWGNSWSYAENGMWISRGVTYDTLFNVWSISTMLPSAAYVAIEKSNGAWSLNQYVGER